MTTDDTPKTGADGSVERPVGRPAPERLKFAEVCALMPEGVSWGEHLTPQIARELVEAGVYAERERWQQVAKAVIESHDAALSYVYERLRSQGVGSITIPDSAVAEIRAVNALRELVQPNAKVSGAGTASAGLPG